MNILAVVVAFLTATVAEANIDGRFLESLFKTSKLGTDTRRNLLTKKAKVAAAAASLSKPVFLTHDSTDLSADTLHRHLGQDGQLACDQAFMTCMPLTKCVSCFGTLQDEGIDWASVSADTPCTEVVKFLFKSNFCLDMKDDNAAIDTFCSTYDVCVAWYDDQNGSSGTGGSGKSASGDTTKDIDCSTITTCTWEGIHPGWIGDGICHENYPGCYNTQACNFDGGDCCEDKCEDWTQYAECGHDGYACRDPNSDDCDPKLTSLCESPDKGKGQDKPDPSSVLCTSDEAKYRLVMFDSFGDGWDETKITLTPNGRKDFVIFKGGLENGAQGTEFICLSKAPKCYHIIVNGGVWGNEVSWELRPLSEGTKALADGGAPMDCNFGIGITDKSCLRTCTGKPNVNATDDIDYRTYNDLYTCIKKQCLIQVGTCLGDESCSPCFAQEAPEYCFANDNFNAVIDCGLCQCTDNYDDFCISKQSGPGAVIPSPDNHNTPVPCTAAETLKGSSAVMQFAICSNFDQVGMMVTDFDENNFGALDQFEACAHSFANEPDKGGHTAMHCMGILADAIQVPGVEDEADDDSGAPEEAIAALASLVYHNAEDFCECASKASSNCPLCPSFMRFKTLLYESLDACKALDEIDCAAWHEFYPKCKANLEEEYTSINFLDSSQCDYVKANCGNAGPFPAFRKLDCDKELSKTDWDFYKLYAKSCLEGNDGIPPSQPPSPAIPTGEPPSPVVTSPPISTPTTPNDNFQPFDDDTPIPYLPSDDDVPSKEYPSSGGKKKNGSSHFWRNIIILGTLGCGAYFYYKRNNDSFSFVRYRNAPRNFGQESEMMMGGGAHPLRMADSGNFEPPSLPPPPSAMGMPQQMGGYP